MNWFRESLKYAKHGYMLSTEVFLHKIYTSDCLRHEFFNSFPSQSNLRNSLHKTRIYLEVVAVFPLKLQRRSQKYEHAQHWQGTKRKCLVGPASAGDRMGRKIPPSYFRLLPLSSKGTTSNLHLKKLPFKPVHTEDSFPQLLWAFRLLAGTTSSDRLEKMRPPHWDAKNSCCKTCLIHFSHCSLQSSHCGPSPNAPPLPWEVIAENSVQAVPTTALPCSHFSWCLLQLGTLTLRQPYQYLVSGQDAQETQEQRGGGGRLMKAEFSSVSSLLSSSIIIIVSQQGEFCSHSLRSRDSCWWTESTGLPNYLFGPPVPGSYNARGVTGQNCTHSTQCQCRGVMMLRGMTWAILFEKRPREATCLHSSISRGGMTASPGLISGNFSPSRDQGKAARSWMAPWLPVSGSRRVVTLVCAHCFRNCSI